MKKIIVLLIIALLNIITPSCLEDYLDREPEAGLSENEVFSTYANFMRYFDVIWNHPDYEIQNAFGLWLALWGQKYTFDCLTDIQDQGRYRQNHAIKKGNMAGLIGNYTYSTHSAHRPILASMFQVIRRSNMAIEKIDKITDVTERDKNDIMAQAYFYRGFAHFELMRFWGPMPHITHVIKGDDEWDLARPSKYESFRSVALDMDTALIYFEKANLMRRDALSGSGHLTNENMFRPNGVAAKAFKSRALLYAASPLNNDQGKGITAWEDAAKVSWEAIEIAKQYGYELLPVNNYKKNFVEAEYSNEQLWGFYAGNYNWNSGDLAAFQGAIIMDSKNSASGICPTQNHIDRYETKWGDPLNTSADREAAAAKGHYNEQDPYKDREPRFYMDIIYNQAPLVGFGAADIYWELTEGTIQYGQFLNPAYQGITKTGYMQQKYWAGESVKNKTRTKYTDPIIRLGELYLNYAEAANEAYGPNTPAPGASMSAVQAVNLIRNRLGHVDVLPEFTGGKEIFRNRIKCERTKEFFVENNHYYHDIRRWLDVAQAMSSTLMGVDIEKVEVSDTYPTGFKYTRVPLPEERQTIWKEAMMYLPFHPSDNFNTINFVPNEIW